MTKMSEERSQRFSRPEERLIDYGKEEDDKLNLDDVDVWKLAEFFSGFMKQTLGDTIQNIVYDDTPVHIYMDKVLGRLANNDAVSLNGLLHGSQGRTELVGFFLALLELVRLKKIKIKQPRDFDEIQISANNN